MYIYSYTCIDRKSANNKHLSQKRLNRSGQIPGKIYWRMEVEKLFREEMSTFLIFNQLNRKIPRKIFVLLSELSTMKINRQ